MNLKYLWVGAVRRHMPTKLLFAVMKRRGDGNGAESIPAAYLTEWRERLAKYGVGLAGKHILEIGSGRYARLAPHMLAAGARRVTLVDLYAVPVEQPEHYAMLARDCAALGLELDDALARIEVIRGDFVALPAPDAYNKADLAISAAVLEHVRDPGQVLAHCWEWLKPGGVTCHVIDLRDHNLQFRYPFEMLTFSDNTWKRWFDLPGGFHLNRWRVPDYLDAAHRTGFVNLRYDAFIQDQDGARAIMPRLDSRFRNIPEDILSILGISLYGEKSPNNA
jgi:SAM-dependent methyltransferase